MAEVITPAGGLLWIDLEVVLINPSKPSRVRTQFGRNTGRQDISQIVQPLQHTGACEIIVHLIFENNCDQGEAEHRIRSHRLNTRQTLQVHGKRISDLILHFLRAASAPVREDNDLVLA